MVSIAINGLGRMAFAALGLPAPDLGQARP